MRSERLRNSWDENAASYERRSAWLERRFLAQCRPWVGRRATGSTLELAVGTGLNFAHYPAEVRLTGVDWAHGMLEEAGRRASQLGRPVDLHQADVMDLPFDDGRFDAVVCTFSLCGVPDVRAVVGQAARILRPGGRLLLADHVASTHAAVRALQHLLEWVTIPAHNEHFTRRPLRTVEEVGLQVVETERTDFGAIERVHARKVS